MRLDEFIKAVEALQAETVEALLRPVLGPGAEQHYLLLTGTHQGLQRAKDLVVKALEDKLEQERDL